MSSRFLDAPDGTRLHVVTVGDGDTDVLIVGGLAEHARRYDHVAAAFITRGARVHLMELRGHGNSGGRRSHVLSWSEYRDDLGAVAATLRPGWVLFAHSMGGLVALDAVGHGLRPSRLALSNPLLGVKMRVPAWKSGVGRALSRLWPSLALTNELDPAHLSRDLTIGRAYATDPDVYKKVTARWFTEMTAAQARVAAMGPAPMSVCFFLSESDPITDAAQSRRVSARIGGAVREQPGMLHELVNELGKDALIAEVGTWLLD
ncbi:MAG: alpha/beta fold hydrolase [Myxococcales bacterium]|nr:alpha/beta fold hydrolase [Myxococcales bacterium]